MHSQKRTLFPVVESYTLYFIAPSTVYGHSIVSGNSTTTGKTISSPHSNSTPTCPGFKVSLKGITPPVIVESKQKRLCFWCGAKYHVGHKCVKSNLYQILLEPQSDREGKYFQECVEQLEDHVLKKISPQSLILSSHAI